MYTYTTIHIYIHIYIYIFAYNQIRDIGRRMATDKMIMCMVLVLICMVVGLIVMQVLGINPAAGLMSIDCSLDFAKVYHCVAGCCRVCCRVLQGVTG